MSNNKDKPQPQRSPGTQAKVKMGDGKTLLILQPQSVPEEQRMQLRRLQKARAVATCIVIAAQHGDNARLDLAHAVSGLGALIDEAIRGLDLPEGSS